jgi:hypothetical protein
VTVFAAEVKQKITNENICIYYIIHVTCNDVSVNGHELVNSDSVLLFIAQLNTVILITLSMKKTSQSSYETKHLNIQLIHVIKYVDTIKIIKYLKVFQHVSDYTGSIISETCTVLGQKLQ